MSTEDKNKVIESVKTELISTYGKINSTGYTVLGVLYAALDRIKN